MAIGAGGRVQRTEYPYPGSQCINDIAAHCSTIKQLEAGFNHRHSSVGLIHVDCTTSFCALTFLGIVPEVSSGLYTDGVEAVSEISQIAMKLVVLCVIKLLLELEEV